MRGRRGAHKVRASFQVGPANAICIKRIKRRRCALNRFSRGILYDLFFRRHIERPSRALRRFYYFPVERR